MDLGRENLVKEYNDVYEELISNDKELDRLRSTIVEKESEADVIYANLIKRLRDDGFQISILEKVARGDKEYALLNKAIKALQSELTAASDTRDRLTRRLYFIQTLLTD